MKILVGLTLMFFLLFLMVPQHDNLIVSKFKAAMAKSSHLVMFVAFNAIVMVILVGNSKPSTGDLDWFFRLSPPLAYHETVDECDGEKEENDEDYEGSDSSNNGFVPTVAYIEYKEQKAKDDQDCADHSCNEDSNGANHGYDDGYDEDNDDDEGSDINDGVSSEDEGDDQLKRRVEEFIDKIYKKWKEELLNDHKLLRIAAA